MKDKPKKITFIILAIFTVLITLQPFFLHEKINIFELGIYLPGINSVLNGQIPYRDFFYLRGPFEIYFPAFFMMIFGNNIAVLSAIFYVSTVFMLILYIFLGSKLMKTRFCLFLFALVLVSRTFPRVVFSYWGGFRFLLGVLVLLALFYFILSEKRRWLFTAGIITAISLLTSIDVGISSLLASFSSIIFMYLFLREKKGKKGLLFSSYFSGLLIFLTGYFIYLYSNHALNAYFDSVSGVVLNLSKVFNPSLSKGISNNILRYFADTIHFKFVTPVFLYIFLLIYFIRLIKRRNLDKRAVNLAGIGTYGLAMYIFSFRIIEGAQFEMALQPEKLILFLFLEEIYILLKGKRAQIIPAKNNPWSLITKLTGDRKIIFINFVILAFFMSSVCYSVLRFARRFPAWQYAKYKLLGRNTQELDPVTVPEGEIISVDRLGNLVLPKQQARTIREVKDFVDKKTKPDDTLVFYHELGLFNYMVNRPFAGRFPLVIFSWIKSRWHKEFMQNLNSIRPKYIFLDNQLPAWFGDTYFKYPPNVEKYNDFIRFLHNNYLKVRDIDTIGVYGLKG